MKEDKCAKFEANVYVNDFLGWFGIIPIFLFLIKDFLGTSISFLSIFFGICLAWGVLCKIYFAEIRNALHALKDINFIYFLKNHAMYRTSKIFLMILASSLSFILCINVFKIPYGSYPFEFSILILSGILAFTFLSYQASFLFLLTQCIVNLNFYSDNLSMLIYKFNKSEVVPLFIILLLFIIKFFKEENSKQKILKYFLEIAALFILFFLPYLIAYSIDLISNFEFFKNFYKVMGQEKGSSFFILILLCTFGVGILLTKIFENHFILIVIAQCLVIITFFPALKSYAHFSNNNRLMDYKLIYEKALQDQSVGLLSNELHFEDAARVGHPKAMHKVARSFLSTEELRYLNIENIDKYVRYLYFAAIFGEKEAINDLKLHARIGEEETFFKDFIIVFFNHKSTDVQNFAKLYLGTYYAVDLGFHNLKDTSTNAVEFRNKNKVLGKKILLSLLNTRLKIEALLRLSDVALLEGDSVEAERLLLEALKSKDKNALYKVGKAYFDGEGFVENRSTALNYLKQAKNLSHIDASYIWSRETLDSKLSSQEDLKEAYTMLIQLFYTYHPQARIDIALRYIADSHSLKGLKAESLLGQGEITTPEDMHREGIVILEELAMLGKNVDFPDNTHAYLPTIFGAEIILATYTLAVIHYYNNDYEQSLELLSRKTQKNDHKSRILLRKICAQHNINPNTLN